MDRNLSLVSTGDKPHSVFHWSKSAAFIDPSIASSGLKKTLNSLQNESGTMVVYGSGAGKGLYVAPNPIMTSEGYGYTLLEIPVVPHSEFAIGDSAQVLDSGLAGVVYDLLGHKKSAAVIRSQDVIDLDHIISYDGSRNLGVTLNDFEPFKGASWREAMKHYRGLFISSGRSYQSEVIGQIWNRENIDIISEGTSFIDKKGEMTDLGTAMILLGEIDNFKPSEKVMKSFPKSDLPGEEYIYNERFKAYVSNLKSQASQTLFLNSKDPNIKYLSRENYKDLREAGLLPPATEKLDSPLEVKKILIDQVKKRVPRDIAKAYLKNLSLLIYESEQALNFDSWKAVNP